MSANRRLLPLAALLPALLLAGCGGGAEVDTYPTTRGTDVDCKALFADSPVKVAGQDQVSVDDQIASAWGDPAIILRCGVEKPDALTRASACYPVSKVNWFAEKTADGYLFTTIGRQFYISMEVPGDYNPEADALADVAEAIIKHDPQVTDCA